MSSAGRSRSTLRQSPCQLLPWKMSPCQSSPNQLRGVPAVQCPSRDRGQRRGVPVAGGEPDRVPQQQLGGEHAVQDGPEEIRVVRTRTVPRLAFSEPRPVRLSRASPAPRRWPRPRRRRRPRRHPPPTDRPGRPGGRWRRSACFTWSGRPGRVRAGGASATPPDTTAAAMDVPLPCRYDAVDRSSGRARRPRCLAPGVTPDAPPAPRRRAWPRRRPVGPREEKSGSRSSPTGGVPRSSTAPTVSTQGSSPGLEMVPGDGPRLLAATVTTMPACHARSTA